MHSPMLNVEEYFVVVFFQHNVNSINHHGLLGPCNVVMVLVFLERVILAQELVLVLNLE